MKLLIKLSFITFLGLPLFSYGNPIVEVEPSSTIQQSTPTLLQDADTLFIEGSRTSNTELIRQAKDKYSLWLNENDKTANNKELAQALRSRAGTSITLGDIKDAIIDYKKSNQYDPVSEIQLGICFLEKKQGAIAAVLQACYAETVQMFTDKHTPKTDVNYLLTRILSGDKTAITEYKNIIQTELNSEQREIYIIAAQEYLDEDFCKQILMNCERNNN